MDITKLKTLKQIAEIWGWKYTSVRWLVMSHPEIAQRVVFRIGGKILVDLEELSKVIEEFRGNVAYE